MNFHQFFRNIFGLPDRKPPDGFDRTSDIPKKNEFRNPIWNLDEDDDDDEDFRSMQPSPFSFQVFTNPIEMNRFFEHQMEQMMKNFQMHIGTLDNFDPSSHFTLMAPERMPETEGWNQGSLREQYLKPSFESGHSEKKNTDKDLDDRVKANGLDSVLKDRPLLDIDISPSVPNNPDQGLGLPLKTFGRSIVTQIVRRPDGTVEHHSTVKDSHGNEKTTLSRQIRDQMYTVTTEVDRNGLHKRTENFVNIDEGNLTEFEKKWNHSNDQKNEGIDDLPKNRNWFPFDKFFQ